MPYSKTMAYVWVITPCFWAYHHENECDWLRRHISRLWHLSFSISFSIKHLNYFIFRSPSTKPWLMFELHASAHTFWQTSWKWVWSVMTSFPLTMISIYTHLLSPEQLQKKTTKLLHLLMFISTLPVARRIFFSSSALSTHTFELVTWHYVL